MHEPLVSIIIPTFNRPDILPDTINNVLAQTWQKTQIIIIDDGTSEKSMEVVKSYNDDRIIYKKTKENLEALKILTAREENIDFEYELAEMVCGDSEHFPY